MLNSVRAELGNICIYTQRNIKRLE